MTWQPISTAPLDRRVLLWCGDGDRQPNVSSVVFGRVSAYDDGERFVTAEGMHGDWNFTHWMPLPEPPEGTET